MNETRIEFKVPKENYPRLAERLEKLNRRAVKLGCAPAVHFLTGETLLHAWDKADLCARNSATVTWLSDDQTNPGDRYVRTGAIRVLLHVTVLGEAPKYAGWSFAATLAISEGGVILRKAPGFKKELVGFREVSPVCEHCKLERNRRDTFVLAHEDGTLKQVGRNCLRDFLGHQDPALIAAQAEWRMSIDEACSEAEGESGCRVDRLTHLGTFLEHVAEYTLQKGFISRKQAQERAQTGESCDSTAFLAAINMDPPPYWVKHGLVLAVSDEAKALAATAHQYALDTFGALTELNDFQHNLLTVAKCEAIESRQQGIAAYLVENYRRSQEQAAKQAKLGDSKHWGEVKKRYKAQPISYLGSNSFESAFGTCFIHRFASADGALLVWKTGTSVDYAQGFTVPATFTVKEHSDYKGRKQTLISRVIFLDTTASTK